MLKFEIESKTIAEFKRLNESGSLILQPEYQRKVVWPDQAKVSLMETILLGYPIPEIYLAYITTPDGDETASVVDGQQRLTALIDFIEDRFKLHNLEDDDLKAKYDGLNFSELPPLERQAFFQYRFPIRRLSNMDDAFIREVFARVNRVNMVLTEQELRNALLPGPFNDFLRDTAEHPISLTSGLFSGARTKRGGDLEFYAEVFSTCLFGIANKKSELNERYDRISRDFELFQDSSIEFLDILTFLSSSVKWEGRTRWSNIVDMYSLLEVSWKNRAILLSDDFKKIGQFRQGLDDFQKIISELKRNGSSAEQSTLQEAGRLATATGLTRDKIVTYADQYIAGVRNSSDLGARRSRSYALNSIISALI
ncbi:DUF262 domain-containing protein [Glutamicibacter sp. NPDC055491]